MRKSVSIAGVALALSLMVAGPVSGRANAQTPADTVPTLTADATAAEACDAVFDRVPSVDAPSQGLVSPTELISFNLTWGAGWKRDATVEVLGCTAVDGAFSGDLSTRNREVQNDGLLVHEFNVPAALPDGARICERAVVIGQSTTGTPKAERLEPECFTVAGGREVTSAPSVAAPRGDPGSGGAGSRALAGSPAPTAKRRDPVAVSGEGAPQAPGTAPAAGSAGLASTGSGDRLLVATAGLLLLLGGWTVACGRPPHAVRSR